MLTWSCTSIFMGSKDTAPGLATSPTDIYDDGYAPSYERLFVEHPFWEPKRAFNTAAIASLLSPLDLWLDTCCGQGWHLARFPHHRRLGLDASAAQIKLARRHNPGVPFIQANLADHEFPGATRFDLITQFWSSYSYLNDEASIRALVTKLVRWTAPGGALYLELTVPEALEDFNASDFAKETHTRVVLQSADGVRWQFHDPGGIHRMMSPPLEFFTDLVAPHFAQVESSAVVQTLRQFIARRKHHGDRP